MAKVLGFISPNINGKIGNTVFSVNKGKTVARVYQPIVANPKTPQQQINREAFASAVSFASSWRVTFDRLYGTGFLPSFSALVQLMRNMPSMIQYKSFDYYKIKPFKNLFNTIGQNVDKDSIAAFDLQFSTMRDIAADSSSGLEMAFVFGYWNSEIDARANLDSDIFFGSDYALSGIDCVYLPNGAASGGLNYSKADVSSIMLTNVTGDFESGNGERVKGFQKTLDACGTGWRYYYKLKNRDRRVSFGTFDETISTVKAAYINSSEPSTSYIFKSLGDTEAHHGCCSVVMLVGKRASGGVGSSKGSILLSSGIMYAGIGSVSNS